MKLHELAPAAGSRKKRKRIGRGPGSGMGSTSTRGNKGHNSRSGGGVRPGFEGGQMPIHRRLPKRGFTNIFKENVAVINVNDLDRFDDGATIDIAALKDAGLIKNRFDSVKVLGNGEVKKKFSLKQCKASKIAKEKIEAAGGSLEIAQ